MKKFYALFYVLFSFVLVQNAFSQQLCTRNIAQFQSAPGGYVINGSATLVQQADGSLKLTLSSNFSTTAGPDLKIYLAEKLASPTGTGNISYEVAPLTAAAGAQTYTIGGVKIGTYLYVLIHCKAFNHLWGGGLLGAGTGSCSPTANETDIPKPDQMAVYPNPVQNGKLFLSENGSIQVFDILGREVMPQQKIEQPMLDVRHLPKGMYLIRINQAITRKFVVN